MACPLLYISVVHMCIKEIKRFLHLSRGVPHLQFDGRVLGHSDDLALVVNADGGRVEIRRIFSFDEPSQQRALAHSRVPY